VARRSSVRYWSSRNAYCCWFAGKQHVLAEGADDYPSGPTYQAATQKFAELSALSGVDGAKDTNTCRVICEMYLRWISTRRKFQTMKLRQKIYVFFTDALGEIPVKDLTHHMVYKWLDQMREWRKHPGTGKPTRWTDGSVRNACTSLQVAFNWAARSGIITKNPLKGLEQPDARSRGRLALIGKTPNEREANHQKILATASSAFRPLIKCLHATGCRPGELAHATAADFNEELGAIMYHAEDKRLEGEFSHKTGRKGKERIIMLSGEALEIVKGLVKKNPSGPLFRTGRGRRLHKHLGRSGWTVKEITNRFRVIRERLKMPRLTAYSYRHTFATAWLEQGRSVEILSELLGNSPLVIRHHYSHLLSDTANLRNQLEDFKLLSAGEKQNPSASQPSALAS
jgi:integrase